MFSGAKETHPDILRGGHRNPYQLKNAIKSGGTVFCIYHFNDNKNVNMDEIFLKSSNAIVFPFPLGLMHESNRTK